MGDGRTMWTAQQELAIEASGRDVLVTASAGTGKTAVLAERCVRILSDPAEPVDAGGILVMTFTEAAAEEMQLRIAARLRERFAATRDRRIRHQLLMIEAAEISTIHAFCKRLITEHFYCLGIDPAFRILEPDEQLLLKSDVLRRITEEAWSDPSLAAGLAVLLERRNVGGGRCDFLNNIVCVSDFLDSLPVRRTFYERARALSEMVSSVSEEQVRQQHGVVLSKLHECREMLLYAQMLDRRLAGAHWSEQIDADFLAPVEQCISLLAAGKTGGCAEILLNYESRRFDNKPRDMAGEIAEIVKGPAKRAMDSFKRLGDLAVISPDYAEIVNASANLQTKVLVELVQRFDRAYVEGKRRANCLDFADLEHLALRLLEENADITAKLRDRFKHVFIDEYQDINALQQAIIDRIASGNNVFAVGDIKQSIYGFRQSRPEIFLTRLAGASDAPEAAGRPLRVDLGHNFRSRKGILDFVNAVFARIMKSSVAAIDYDDRAALTAGFEYRPPENASRSLVEMIILDEDDSHDDTDAGETAQVISAVQRQAAFIASRIQRMVGAATGKAEFEIYDRQAECYRPVRYGDIVILMRGLAHTAREYVEILRLGGVPVNSQSCAGYFAATEISDCICLLKVLDNPRQDIEFASVLRSPLFGITETELAEICIHAGQEGRRAGFCDRLRQYCADGPDGALRLRLGVVMERLERWRQVACRQGLADLLTTVYSETDYAAFVSALPNGRQRKANLYKLHDRAVQFGGFATTRTTSLSRFVDYIEELLDRGEDWAPAAPETAAENAVRLMSIHKSKGLEFPVVFLAETNRKFNMVDTYSDCLVDDPETIGLRIIEPHSGVKLGSLAHQVISEKKLGLNIAEEMRLLYVAATRARERLVITASRKAAQCVPILTGCAAAGDEPLADWQIRSARCHFDWLLYAFGNRRRMLNLYQIAGGDETDDGALFVADMIDRARLDKLSAAIMAKRKSAFKGSPGSAQPTAVSCETADLVERIAGNIRWVYPWADVTGLPAKQSVSELTHRDDEFVSPDLTAAFQRLPALLHAARAEKSGLDARSRGTAAHLVLQHIDLSGPVTAQAVEQTVRQLVAAGKVPEQVAAAIDMGAILRFFASNLGQLMVANAADAMREWPFTIGLDARELGAASAGESVVVQGIIDVVVKSPAGLTVIDFKTDNVYFANVEERAQMYASQITCYAKAAGSILQRPVASAWLYFLACDRAVEIPVTGTVRNT